MNFAQHLIAIGFLDDALNPAIEAIAILRSQVFAGNDDDWNVTDLAPMTYFIKPGNGAPTDSRSLPSELSSIASRVHHLAADRSLTKPEQEAMKLVEISIRQAAVLTAAILKTDGLRRDSGSSGSARSI